MAAFPVFLHSCAAPASVKRVGAEGEQIRLRSGEDLGQLLELALADSGSAHSSHHLAHFVEEWKNQVGQSDTGELTATDGEGNGRKYRVRFDGSHGAFPLSYFDELSPAVDYEVKKIPHYERDGVGAPLVALRENRQETAIEKHYPPEAITRPITAVARKGEIVGGVQEVEIQLLCPLMESEVRLEDGKSHPLAADFTVPWAALLARAGDLAKSRYRDPLKRNPTREPRLYLMEHYDPKKEPLIMIHGLFDSPLVWAKLSNELWNDDDIRNRYQIWHYLYNTSAPALYSGRLLQNQLREIRPLLDPTGKDPAMQSTTVIAHSMGSIVTRRLITEPGNAFWDAAFTRSIDSLELSASDRADLEQAFFWEPERHVKRVIYVAASHLGSDHADNFFGRLGRSIVKPPGQFKEFYARISSANPGAFTEAYAALGEGKLDSVGALSPKKPSLPILASLPNSHAVAEHSIIGNRGKPGPIEQSSDGIVEYWSSHIDRAVSEKIVPYDHYAIDHEETVVEIKRILKLR